MTEKTFFESSSGTRLCGILSRAGSQKTIAILSHGFHSNKDKKVYIDLEQIINKRGISTFRFDFFGSGKSSGKFEDFTVSEAVSDLKAAIGFVKKRGFDKIILFGSSFGGQVSILVASESRDISALVLRCPVSGSMAKLLISLKGKDPEEWKREGIFSYKNSAGQRFRLKYSFYEDSIKINDYERARKIKASTLIVHGDSDNTVPIENSIKLSKVIPKCKLEVLKGTNHHFTNPSDYSKMMNLIVDFIEENK